MNDSKTNNNEVEYFSMVYIVLKPNTDSRKILGFHREEGVQWNLEAFITPEIC